MSRKANGRKGTFSDLGLSVAGRYLVPSSRNRLLLIGGIAVAALLVVAFASFLTRGSGLLASGPLSSNHATLEEDCAACHRPFDEVTSDACSVCHEKYGDKLGVYTFAAHYLYRSNDFQRLVPSEHETSCAACHLEHRGREAEITEVPDERCLVCHENGSFHDQHPEFDFAAEGLADDDALRFPHVHHVRELIKKQELVDVEKACLYCHNPRPDGKSFEPLDFERHCDSCHLTTTTATPRLPVWDPEQPEIAGVETLGMIRERGGPGTRWALFTSPGEFREVGRRVSKVPVYHEDPWILDNLRRLRRELYADPGLADLLKTSAEVPAHEISVLYEEAIATLEDHALGLRGRPEPEVQAELERITALLEELRRAVRDPYTPLDETAFLLALGEPRSDLGSDRIEEIHALIGELTQPCQRCHRVENATIARVQKDQRVLRRAEFDHRAHILQVRCLECHAEIPIQELAGSTDPVAAELDQAAIQNLPRIATCRQCHTPQLASDRCVTCHYFHANKSRRSEMLLYVN